MKRTRFMPEEDTSPRRQRTKPPKTEEEVMQEEPEDEGESVGKKHSKAASQAVLVGALGLPALQSGRPRIIQSPERFDELVDEYLAYCLSTPAPITLNGMQLWLGFTSHRSFYDYAKYEGYSQSVARACKIVEFAYEMRLNGSNYAGAIFALKNFGWMDERGAAGAYARRERGVAPPPIGHPDEGGPTLDISALDDDALEALMNALSQESVSRELAPSRGGRGQVH